MKAFEFFNDFGDVQFRDDCQYIWDYLSSVGTINFTKRDLAKYYEDFSESYCAGWLDPKADNGKWLSYFAEWLSNEDM